MLLKKEEEVGLALLAARRGRSYRSKVLCGKKFKFRHATYVSKKGGACDAGRPTDTCTNTLLLCPASYLFIILLPRPFLLADVHRLGGWRIDLLILHK